MLEGDISEVMKLSDAITNILPINPENIGIPILALQLVRANYIEWVRRNVNPEQAELFEDLLRRTEIDAQVLMEKEYERMDKFKK